MFILTNNDKKKSSDSLDDFIIYVFGIIGTKSDIIFFKFQFSESKIKKSNYLKIFYLLHWIRHLKF